MPTVDEWNRAQDDAKQSNTFARSGAQAAILINGGAATAILARPNSLVDIAHGPFPAVAIALYAVGVSLGAIAFPEASKSVEQYMMAWQTDGRDRKHYHDRGDRLWKRTLGLIYSSLACFTFASVMLAFAILRAGIH